MNRKSFLPVLVVLALIGATAALLVHVKNNRRLGEPGIKTRPLGTGKNLEVLLPETVPGWTSEISTNSETALLALPADTSFRVRVYYTETKDFSSQLSAVLMGADRSSIHQPQICLPGQGWRIDDSTSGITSIHMEKPVAYDLPVMRLTLTLDTKDNNGQPLTIRGQFIYWFVDADRFTADQNSFKWEMARHVLKTGTLDRWAYISFFSYGLPGQEEQVFERMKKLIATTVPEFQLVPRAGK